eukprot:1534288-Rhodomonas_salina.1
MTSPFMLASNVSVGNSCLDLPLAPCFATACTPSDEIAPTTVTAPPSTWPILRWSVTTSSHEPLARRMTTATGSFGAAITA